MSLYYVQKLLFQLNRDPALQKRFRENAAAVLSDYDLTDEEQKALIKPDIGELYIMGVNGQLLMHFAAFQGYSWDQYINAMKEALIVHGNVKSGLYASLDGGAGGAV